MARSGREPGEPDPARGLRVLVGPNGSGKTTLMNPMTGGGSGHCAGALRFWAVRRMILKGCSRFWGPQCPCVPEGATVFEFIYLYPCRRARSGARKQWAWRVIERVNLVEAAKKRLQQGNAVVQVSP